ncbi:MAG TPA: GNAT family protein [Vicinamibacterales bacterium]|jgi:RimJ/RimL family protein N-acetyltransferase|nr:GNAT family protein [Vicinamibacterales bacterium]
MAVSDPSIFVASSWRATSPVLVGPHVTLREPAQDDVRTLVDLLSLSDATRFGLDDPPSEFTAQHLVDEAARERAAGRALTLVVTVTASQAVVGLVQVRQLDPQFEAAEWEWTIAPESRGNGIFLESARLVGSLAFGAIGVHRLEARALLQNGRANGALRKLGAVQEGILRRSARRSNEYLDQVLWAVLRDDWAKHWVSTAPLVH